MTDQIYDYVQSLVEVAEVHILQKDVKDVSEDQKKHIFKKDYLLLLLTITNKIGAKTMIAIG